MGDALHDAAVVCDKTARQKCVCCVAPSLPYHTYQHISEKTTRRICGGAIILCLDSTALICETSAQSDPMCTLYC